jgi:hypothetical protein
MRFSKVSVPIGFSLSYNSRDYPGFAFKEPRVKIVLPRKRYLPDEEY